MRKNYSPPVAGADFRAALVASCLRGALPPVLLRAVCLVRAIFVHLVFNYEFLDCVDNKDNRLFDIEGLSLYSINITYIYTYQRR